jgi:hypothetical protein
MSARTVLQNPLHPTLLVLLSCRRQKKEKGKGNSSKNKDNSWQMKAACQHCGEIKHIHPNCPVLQDNDDKEMDADKTDAPPKSSEDSKSTNKRKKRLLLLSSRLSMILRASPKANLQISDSSTPQFL